MHLTYCLLLVLFLMLVDGSSTEPIDQPGRCALAVLIAVAATSLLGIIQSSWFWRRVRLRDVVPSMLERRIMVLRTCQIAVLFIVVVGVCWSAKWANVVRGNWQLAEWPLLDELLILSPIILATLPTWLVSLNCERNFCRELSASQSVANEGDSAIADSIFQFKIASGLVLLPVLAVYLVRDAAGMAGVLDWSPPAIFVLSLAGLTALLLAMPVIMTMTLKTRRLPPGKLSARLEQTSLDGLKIFVWDTGGRVANAFVAGTLRPFQRILLTDVLLSEFDDREIEAIVRHEVAHIERRHLALKLAVVIAPIISLSAAMWWMPEMRATLLEPVMILPFAGPLTPLSILLPIYLIMVGVSLVCVSRDMEHEADVDACRRPEFRLPRPGACKRYIDASGCRTFVACLEKLASASSQSKTKSTWLHPSIQSRIDFLELIRREPATYDNRRDHWRAKRWAAMLLPAMLLLSAGVWLTAWY